MVAEVGFEPTVPCSQSKWDKPLPYSAKIGVLDGNRTRVTRATIARLTTGLRAPLKIKVTPKPCPLRPVVPKCESTIASSQPGLVSHALPTMTLNWRYRWDLNPRFSQ